MHQAGSGQCCPFAVQFPTPASTLHPTPRAPRFKCVIHFAGRKYVNESVDNPLRYYDHNVLGTVNLCKTMKKHGCKSMVFSSSCTVYGNPQVCAAGARGRGCWCETSVGIGGELCEASLEAGGGRLAVQSALLPHPSPRPPLLTPGLRSAPLLPSLLPLLPSWEQYVPIDEAHPLKAVSPYGATKLMIEDILRDVSASDPDWRIILLRYFNPVGAHPSGGFALGCGCGWLVASWGGGGWCRCEPASPTTPSASS